jgi:glycosyltransferase involved in cell wall biosynthesis
MDNETLYFLQAGRYPRRTDWMLRHVLGSFDALVCVGRFQCDLARLIAVESRATPRILECRSAVADERLTRFSLLTPRLDSRQILFIGHGPGEWRGWYKGLDLLLETSERLDRSGCEHSLVIIGGWDGNLVAASQCRHRDHIHFAGPLTEFDAVLAQSSLYLHLARGEAWGISVLEAMAAGVPAMVSEWTGAKEAVSRVDARLVVPLDTAAVASRVEWYLALPVDHRHALGQRARAVAAQYTEARAKAVFAQAIEVASRISPRRNQRVER